MPDIGYHGDTGHLLWGGEAVFVVEAVEVNLIQSASIALDKELRDYDWYSSIGVGSLPWVDSEQHEAIFVYVKRKSKAIRHMIPLTAGGFPVLVRCVGKVVAMKERVP